MRIGLVQITASDDPAANLAETSRLIRAAAADGAELVATPEVTNCVSLSRNRQNEVLQTEDEDRTLAALRALAAELGIWCLIGSLALRTNESRFANRQVLISPDGQIAARYDKIHMFDVDLPSGEQHRESDGFRPGDRAVLADIGPGALLGMTICYDLRFPALYRRLAQAGATLISIPAAFTRHTGLAHWEPLIRARAIETGAFVLAPAQTGHHPAIPGARTRETHGHSLVVDPWGTVLLDMGRAPGAACVDLDLAMVDKVRAGIPSLTHDRDFAGPIRHG